jgi:hypothetical protein
MRKQNNAMQYLQETQRKSSDRTMAHEHEPRADVADGQKHE